MTDIPRDQPARDRIRTDLATNMLVEAGAGSGKTTALVARMLEHVRTGTAVDRLAAVTFTRKAANELRERFQVGLERAAREAMPGSDEARHYERALRELDRAFLGTVHAFCARLLRERPLEAGLDPAFEEITDESWLELQRRFWRRWIERAKRTDDPDLAALAAVGLEPPQLSDAFGVVLGYPDVDFPLGDAARPDAAPCRQQLEALLADARRLMPSREPAAGWDKLMQLVRRLEFRRSIGNWDDVAQFCAAIEAISKSACDVTQNRWATDKAGKAAAKAHCEEWLALLDGPIANLLCCWREHRYPIVMRVLQRAARDFAAERRATGQLSFEDLLLLTARLLREHPVARAELGARYAHLLVDEFQDTDPVQAEVCFLLASDPAQGTDWRTVVPRSGSLFVVGDPKQSIYRFRRADIQVYEFVKQRMAQCGAVLALTSNFRSVRSIETVVNGHFASAFPAEATAEQAAYRPMETAQDPAGEDGVYRYALYTEGREGDGVLVRRDAERVASWIAGRITPGGRTAGDFLILTARKAHIAQYARALSERNVPVSTTGATLTQEHELSELVVVLRAIADPENAILVAAALEGLFFGLSPADLWEGKQARLRFAITHPPDSEDVAVGRALRQLHEWWRLSQRHPVDVLLERILDDTGLLVHAASEELGEARAGALLHLVDAMRDASAAGATAVTDALERLELLLAAEAPDAPLRPGRTDAVRVMNLHKAKGLEAEVVVLAAPVDDDAWEPTVHVTRGESGAATGGLALVQKLQNQRLLLAHPPGWAEMQAAEAVFAEAERARLLYVAATRAKRELVVAQRVKQYANGSTKPDASMWSPLAGMLATHARVIDPVVTSPPGRRALERTPEELRAEGEAARARVAMASAESFVVRTVTETAKEAPAPGAPGARGGGAGAAWGSAVHRSIEALARGRRGASLAAFMRAVARDEGLDEIRTVQLARVVAELEASEPWRALVDAGSVQVELPVMRYAESEGRAVIAHGVLDAAVLGLDGWQVVDWKSDEVDDAVWADRRRQYQRQVDAYATMLTALTGLDARGGIQRVRA